MSANPAWSGGLCGVPMWLGGAPAGSCDEPANGPQLPEAYLLVERGDRQSPYCPPGPCCVRHGGPAAGDPIIFQDGLTSGGRPMWCAVMPDFQSLAESPAGYNGNPSVAVANLRAAIAAESTK